MKTKVKASSETLVYLGPAYKNRHGANGVRARHRWDTGYQDLVYPSRAAFERAKRAVELKGK